MLFISPPCSQRLSRSHDVWLSGVAGLALAWLQTGERSQPGAGTGALAAVSSRRCPWRVVFVARLSPPSVWCAEFVISRLVLAGKRVGFPFPPPAPLPFLSS